MAIIGFHFNKIHVERTAPNQGKVNISNNVAITDVKKAAIDIAGSNSEGLRFTFTFTSTYEPKVGKIQLEGEVLAMESKKVVDEVLASWKDKKAVPQPMMTGVLNMVLGKCNIEALLLSRDVNLPSPIPLPKVNVNAPAAKGKSKA